MSAAPSQEIDGRGAKTRAVMAAVEAAPEGRTRFAVIKKVTGLETRTLISILYSLQTQGRVAPLSAAVEVPRDDRIYARVDNETVFPVPVVRIGPFKPRRRRSKAPSGMPPATRGTEPSPADDVAVAPNWLMPRLPAGGAKSIGVPAFRHSLVTAADLQDDFY
jgi:hypothetical protein